MQFRSMKVEMIKILIIFICYFATGTIFDEKY
jgi:hypothetical protein